MNFETIKKLGFLTTIESGFSYLKSIFFKKKETNLENFYINRFGYKLYNIFFEKYTEKLWGRSPKNISADCISLVLCMYDYQMYGIIILDFSINISAECRDKFIINKIDNLVINHMINEIISYLIDTLVV